MTSKILSVLILILIAQSGFSQTFDKKKLDSYFEALETNNKFMGSVALARNGKERKDYLYQPDWLIKHNECYSYSFKGKREKEIETDMSIPLGAGAIVSTPADLTQFATALFNGRLVSAQSLVLMKTLKDNYGMGLFKFPFGDRSGYGHNGGIDGFTSTMCHFADNDISMALTSNGTNFNNNQIAITLLSAVYAQPYEIPTFVTVDISTEDLDKYLGVYASTQIPMKITITKNDKTLMAQATGQPSFALETAGEDMFKFDAAGIVLEFRPSDHTMILKQGGGVFNFKRE